MTAAGTGPRAPAARRQPGPPAPQLPPPGPGPYRFPKSLRLRARAEFLRASRGTRIPGKWIQLQRIEPRRGQTGARCGVTVSRKVGNAVQRNRVKRVVREVVRLYRDRLPPGDYVIVARPEAAAAGFHAVAEDLLRAFDKVRGGPRNPPAAVARRRPFRSGT